MIDMISKARLDHLSFDGLVLVAGIVRQVQVKVNCVCKSGRGEEGSTIASPTREGRRSCASPLPLQEGGKGGLIGGPSWQALGIFGHDDH